MKLGAWHWLQTIVLVNPLLYLNEGMRAAFTNASHMHLYIVYPALVGFAALFLSLGAGGEGSVRFLAGARKVGFQLRFAHHAVFRDQIKRKVRG